MAEDEITALRVALHNQLLIIKRLYAELEEEREASAFGADEALSMILRLQEEKAEEEMEHRHYKKMVEAKMHHAQKSLAMLEKVLFQKDIENTSLKYQLEAYKQKLLSIGASHNDVKDVASFDNQIFNKSIASLEGTNFQGDGSLLPTIQPIWRGVGVCEKELEKNQKKHFSREAVVDEHIYVSEQVQGVYSSMDDMLQDQNTKQTVVLISLSKDKETHKNINVDPKSCKEESRSRSCYSIESDDMQMLGNSCLEAESAGNIIQSNNIKDMFEVLDSHKDNLVSRTSSKKVTQEPPLKVNHILDSVRQNVIDNSSRDVDFLKKARRSSTLRKNVSKSDRSVEPHTLYASIQNDIQKLESRIHHVNDDIYIMKQEDFAKELKLLRDMQVQLDMIQSHIRNLISTKHSPQDMSIFVSLTEAMLSFSI